ncbi:MAG: hypothetical protein ACI4MQ_07905 [Candidatus Coproplasma sp.]
MKKMKCTLDDYTADDLPLTRKDVFCECYREHFGLLFKIGLLCLAFLIPVIIVSFMRDLHIISAVGALEEQTAENIATIYYQADVVYGLFSIVAQILFAVLFAGVVQILRQTLWNEPIFFGDDLKRGLKSNSLKYGVTVLFISIINYVVSAYTQSVLYYVLNGIFLVLVVPIAAWFLLQGIYYNLGVFDSLKNAVLLYIKTVPVTLLLLVCTIVPFWLVMNLITLLIVKYLVLVLLYVLYIVPLTMCWMLYASHIFDKFINKVNHPEIYRKGMRIIKE